MFVYPFLPVLPANAGVTVPGTSAGAGTSVGAPTANALPNAGIGRLLFEVTPRQTLQIYVDGYYVGTPDDYPDGIELPAGPHALELRGDNLRPHAAPVQIAASRTITYRATLDGAPPVSVSHRDEPAAGVTGATAAAAPAPPLTAPSVPPAVPSASPFYLIPGCYLGNVPPDEHNTPPGCDRSQVRTQPR